VSCFTPLKAFRTPAGDVKLGVAPGDCYSMELPCGRCVGCRQDRARAWSIRITHEAQLYDQNRFVTLTYAPERMPSSLSLEYRDFQLFMKRLRKEISGVTVLPDGLRPIRFFCAGEYGSRYRRPHWHAVLFNVAFPDEVAVPHARYRRFRSKVADDLWTHGFVDIGSVTPASAAYVAGYTLEKKYGSAAADHYEDVVDVRTGELSSRRPEFARMSLRPGIGTWWFQRFAADLFPADHAVQDGKAYKVPRFYLERWKRDADPTLVEEVLYARYLKAAAQPEENTPERRAVRCELLERKLAQRAREL